MSIAGQSMELLLRILNNMPEYRVLSKAIANDRAPLAVTGLSLVQKAHFIMSLCREHRRPAIFVAANDAQCGKIASDLSAMGVTPLVYPSRDLNLRPAESVSHEYEHARLGVLSRMISDDYEVVVTCADAALLYTLPPAALSEKIITVSVGSDFSPAAASTSLLQLGYTRVEQVDSIGQFAVRGGIIDFYPTCAAAPIRAELWGDQVDSLSYFDIESQRRTDAISAATITPAIEVSFDSADQLADRITALAKSLRGKYAPAAKEKLLHDSMALRDGLPLHNTDKYLPLIYDSPATLFDYALDAMVFVSEIHEVKEHLRASGWQMGEDIKQLLEEGELCRSLTEYSAGFMQMIDIAQTQNAILMDTFARTSYELKLGELVAVRSRQLSSFSGSVSALVEELSDLMDQKMGVTILAGTEKAAHTLASDLVGYGLSSYFGNAQSIPKSGEIIVIPGGLSSSMEYPSAAYAIISYGKPTAGVKKRTRINKGEQLHSLSELHGGDYVVHTTHGIGIFDGIHKLEIEGITKDYIKIKYDKSDVLYVPVTQLDLVSKYIGPKEDTKVKIHRLGGSEWQKSRQRVRSAVKDIARELIKLYAARMSVEGYAFSPDSEWQHDFENHFEYEETDDQLRCTEEIKADMESPTPMDRLLCGDVGFGKTEVAFRAAFKCITDSKQCAVLVPTTILAWQHYQTALRRFDGFPIRIETISRFRTPKQQEDILRRLKRGEIDLIIGTHRLIQKDVVFRDVGLVIVDEEQRFGVTQKEKLKELFAKIDCLTLSATPIPRTLNMALSGIRDMSVIEEAPHDRRPVQTYVLEYDDGVICDAIRRELRRGGQVYFLHNRVDSIESTAARLQSKIPEARIAVAHGKMNEDQLSTVWKNLLENEIDVLVCTTIIETGVDVSNVNTLIIENADRMGLSQLHQIRGRVGRSSRRAFAYLTFFRGKVLSEIATRRLEAIREFTEFGSGFKIAMRDLEIRGAGNVLGGEQHGHMESVGYDMYLRLLSDAVSEEKGEPTAGRASECLIDIQMQAHIPEHYIQSLQQRLDIYRRIADIRNDADCSDVIDELIDRFGDPPDEVHGLIRVALIRNAAAHLGFHEIKQKGTAVFFYSGNLNFEQCSRLSVILRGRVMLSAGKNSYLSVKVLPEQSAIDCIHETLTMLSADDSALERKA